MYKSLIILAIAISVVATVSTAQAQKEEKNGFSKMIGSFNSSIKSGFSKVSKSIAPKPADLKPSDATSLRVKAKPSAKLYMSAANMYAANGDMREAEKMYKRALDISPENANVMSKYAMLKDKMGSYPEAVAMYEKAAKAQPDNAAVYNGLGLCHATHGDLERALAALDKAVNLQPREPKYRNNIAMVLVEAGRYDEAFTHFKTQYKNSVAHYNLGYLIQKRGDKPNAVRHFAAAMKSDPGLSEARVWYNHLAGERAPASQTPARQMPTRQMYAHRQQVQQQQQVVTSPPAQGPLLATRQPPYGGESVQPPVNRPRVWASMRQNGAPQNHSTAQREAAAQDQLNALGPASAPVQSFAAPTPGNSDPQAMAFRSRHHKTDAGNSAHVARQSSIQRLPPIEQSFARTASPTPVRTGTQFNRPVYGHPAQPSTQSRPGQAAAPMPASTVPASPPSSGTTRAPMVYPLPPVNGYQY